MNKDMELLSKLARVERALHREQGRAHRDGGFFADRSRGQGRILAMLQIKDGVTTKELSYLLGIRVSSLNETLAKMEKNGYINRKQSDNDKRVFVIFLTEKGRKAMPKQMESTTVFNCFSDEEKDIFGDLLERLLQELEEREMADNPQENFRENQEKWMEQMRSRMGEEWYEHVMAIHGARRSGGRSERHSRNDFRNEEMDED